MNNRRRGSSDPHIPDPISLLSVGSKHLWFPTIAITALAAYLAWRQGGNGVLLLAILVLTTAVVIAGWIAMRSEPREFPITSQAIAVVGLIATQASIAAWACAYRGLDGGFWINLMTISFIAGILLRTRYALFIGVTGSLTFLSIAVISGQVDAIHLPTLAVGIPYVFILALLAAGHRRAIAGAAAAEQERHVEMLENSNLEMTAVIQSLTEGLLTTDKYGRIQRWNLALERLTGRSEMEASGMSVTLALPLLRGDKACTAEEHPCVQALEGPVFAGSHSGGQGRELVLFGPGGRKSPVTVSAAPLVTESGPAGVAAVVLDVTRERELGRLQDTLISAVSHELRTPLTMILGFSEMLVTGGLTEHEKVECSRQLLDAAQSLNSLVENLLSASALEAGELHLNMRSVPIAGLVESVRQGLPAADQARVRAEVSPHIVVRGDPDRLNQVMQNLIANALKFSSSERAVTVKGRQDASGVVISVIDKGIGVSPDQVDSLFNKFTRADDERVESISGTGLGLYLVEQIVALHEGHIDVSSEVGVGTEIKITLPAP